MSSSRAPINFTIDNFFKTLFVLMNIFLFGFFSQAKSVSWFKYLFRTWYWISWNTHKMGLSVSGLYQLGNWSKPVNYSYVKQIIYSVYRFKASTSLIIRAQKSIQMSKSFFCSKLDCFLRIMCLYSFYAIKIPSST